MGYLDNVHLEYPTVAMLAPGALLQNRYRIVRLSERTAVSTSYEAVDERFGTTVCLKEWELGGADAQRDALLREAKLYNRHFHIALPYAFDTFQESGAVFVAMRLIPGVTLASLLEASHPTVAVDRALHWLDRLLDLLDDLHTGERCIIHGNISPRCVWLTPRGDAVLTDFMFAVEGRGRALGYTLPYAPYEQIQGLEIDARADIYALAATFYHLLTEHPPPNAYERMTGWSNGSAVVLHPADELNPTVPRAIAAVLDRAMSLTHADRIATAAEMRAALRTAGNEASVATVVERRTTGTTERLLGRAAESDTDRIGPPAEESKAPTVALDPSLSITEVRSAQPERGPRTSVICRTCGAANDPLRTFCPFCGSLLRSDRRPPEAASVAVVTITCASCGADNRPGTRACRMCSSALVTPPGFVYSVEDNEPTTGLETLEATTDALGEDLPPTAPVDPAVAAPKADTQLAQLLVLEGEEPGSVLPLNAEETAFGRAQGDHTFPLDIFMSGRHAKITKRDGRFVLVDVGSRNGTFLKIRGATPLKDGDVILAGKQLLRFDPDHASGRPCLSVMLHSGAVGDTLELKPSETTIGRTDADFTFPDDLTLADTHAVVARKEGGYFVSDLGSKNGTFLRVKSDVELEEGDIVILGRHIFRFELSRWQDDYATLKGF